MKINRKDLKVEEYVPLSGKVLIEPFPYMTKKTTMLKPVPVDKDEEGEDKNLSPFEKDVPLMKNVPVKEKVAYEYQFAKIISVSPDSKYKVGDIVIFSVRFVKAFDLFDNAFICSEYDLFGSYKDKALFETK